MQVLKHLLFKKFPNEKYRRLLWLKLSGTPFKISTNKSYYSSLQKEPLNPKIKSQIDKDIPRTFRNPSEEALNKEKLFSILSNYSKRNPLVGYMQGFNFIVAFILKVIPNEEEAFWLFSYILEDILPFNYFVDSIGILTDVEIMKNLMSKSMPDMTEYLAEKNFQTNITNILVKWLVTLFIEGFPEKLSLAIWDIMLINGDITLFKAAISFMKLLKSGIMNSSSIEEVEFVLDHNIKEIADTSKVIFLVLLRRFDFNKETIEAMRAELNGPAKNNNIEFIVLNKINGMNLIENYFYNNCKRKRVKRNNSLTRILDILRISENDLMGQTSFKEE